MNKVVTIDFDKTLTRPDVQDFVKYLISQNVRCYILTYRYDDVHHYKYEGKYPDNEDIWSTATELGLSRNVLFTNCRLKSEYLNSAGNVVLHLDDDVRVMDDLKNNSKVIPIQVKSPLYKNKIMKLLDLKIA